MKFLILRRCPYCETWSQQPVDGSPGKWRARCLHCGHERACRPTRYELRRAGIFDDRPQSWWEDTR
jgi:hypothetical protein